MRVYRGREGHARGCSGMWGRSGTERHTRYTGTYEVYAYVDLHRVTWRQVGVCSSVPTGRRGI